MRGPEILHHYDVKLRPDPSRIIIRPFWPEHPEKFAIEGQPRPQVITDRVLELGDAELTAELERVTEVLDGRHRDIDEIFHRRFTEVAASLTLPDDISDAQRRLLGAYFSQEYSFESAALFNPSVVLHPEQEGVADGSVRFVMSLRGIGEGHVSSVTFRSGTWTPGGALTIDKASETTTSPIIEQGAQNDEAVMVRLHCGGSRVVSENVLFPVRPSQKQGIEDLRLVQFIEDDGSATYYGTYTAFDGIHARSEMLRGDDFRTFDMIALKGDAADAKGMALFPRRINGKYAMLGRQDNENIWLLYSDDLYTWEGGEKLLTPKAPWEFIQLGNCGSPLEIEEGWLVLTHGVGAARNYCVGACLLDKDDPSKVLSRSPMPILEPGPQDRGGYVPNVVYSCGALLKDRTLLLPYAVADSFTAFASVGIDDLLGAMQ